MRILKIGWGGWEFKRKRSEWQGIKGKRWNNEKRGKVINNQRHGRHLSGTEWKMVPKIHN